MYHEPQYIKRSRVRRARLTTCYADKPLGYLHVVVVVCATVRPGPAVISRPQSSSKCYTNTPRAHESTTNTTQAAVRKLYESLGTDELCLFVMLLCVWKYVLKFLVNFETPLKMHE